jgi:hypothetical protein
MESKEKTEIPHRKRKGGSVRILKKKSKNSGIAPKDLTYFQRVIHGVTG